jgi:hypothetical protein
LFEKLKRLRSRGLAARKWTLEAAAKYLQIGHYVAKEGATRQKCVNT